MISTDGVAQIVPQVVVQYDFGTTGTPTTASSVTSTDWTASNFTAGPGLSVSTTTISVGDPAPSFYARSDQTNSSGALALTSNDYFSFTITPLNGYILDLGDISLDFAASWSSTVNRGFAIYSSINGFSSTENAIYSFSTTAAVSPAGTFSTHSISLAGEDYQGITSAVTFRIYLWDGASSTTSYLYVDNVTINTIPEPAPVMLAIGGVFVAMLVKVVRSRTRRQTSLA